MIQPHIYDMLRRLAANGGTLKLYDIQQNWPNGYDPYDLVLAGFAGYNQNNPTSAPYYKINEDGIAAMKKYEELKGWSRGDTEPSRPCSYFYDQENDETVFSTQIGEAEVKVVVKGYRKMLFQAQEIGAAMGRLDLLMSSDPNEDFSLQIGP